MIIAIVTIEALSNGTCLPIRCEDKIVSILLMNSKRGIVKGLLRIIGCDNDTENEREHKFIRQTVDYLDAEYFSILLKI